MAAGPLMWSSGPHVRMAAWGVLLQPRLASCKVACKDISTCFPTSRFLEVHMASLMQLMVSQSLIFSLLAFSSGPLHPSLGGSQGPPCWQARELLGPACAHRSLTALHSQSACLTDSVRHIRVVGRWDSLTCPESASRP